MDRIDPAALRSFLVIRRDNIGDLVCTLPAITALRARFPAARIEALVNSYNRDVLAGHRDLDAVHAYSKGKHRGGESLLSVYLQRVRLLWNLRREGFDCAVLAAPGEQPRALGYARRVRARHILGYVQPHGGNKQQTLHGVDLPVAYQPDAQAHEVEKVFALLAPLASTARRRGQADGRPRALMRVRVALARQSGKATAGPLVALHLSARKPSQRWPVERFAQLARTLCDRHGARLMLLWAPGDETNRGIRVTMARPRHWCASWRGCRCSPIHGGVADLIAALGTSDSVVCADGGAMHLAAALGKPIVALFGDSDAARWHPGGRITGCCKCRRARCATSAPRRCWPPGNAERHALGTLFGPPLPFERDRRSRTRVQSL